MIYRDIARAAPGVFGRNRLRMSPVNDPQAMIALVAASSEQSRILRFHTGMPTLRPAMAEQLADIAPSRGQAMGLWTSRKRLAAEARYMRLSDDLGEVAILIADAYHGRGLGVALLADIYQRAADEGIAALHGEVLSSNDAIVHVMTKLAPVITIGYQDGCRQLCMPLTESACSTCTPEAIPA